MVPKTILDPIPVTHLSFDPGMSCTAMAGWCKGWYLWVVSYRPRQKRGFHRLGDVQDWIRQELADRGGQQFLKEVAMEVPHRYTPKKNLDSVYKNAYICGAIISVFAAYPEVKITTGHKLQVSKEKARLVLTNKKFEGLNEHEADAIYWGWSQGFGRLS